MSASVRDALGALLGYSADEKTGTWWGACFRCGNRKASVGTTGHSCPDCGTVPHDVAETQWAAAAVDALDTSEGIVRVSDVIPERVRWLWPGRIPLGRLSILDGDPGLGKSTLTLDIAARVTRGRPMPDGSRGLDGPRGVVLLGAEDGLADTVRPRLDAAGADVTLVAALQAVRDAEGHLRLPTVADVAAIRRAAGMVDAALLVIDPLSAYLGRGVDGHRDTDVRQALADLAALAERIALAILVARHLSKAGGQNPLYRGGGSIAIIAAARSGLLLARDPDDDDRRILATTKCNLAPPQPSLSLGLVSTEDALRVVWHGPSERSARDLLATEEGDERTQRDEAVELLQAELADGPRKVPDLRHAARAAGVSWRTVERAKAHLRVASVRVGFGPGSHIAWELPAIDRQASWRPMDSEDVADYGNGAQVSQEPGVEPAIGRQAESLAAYGENPAENGAPEGDGYDGPRCVCGQPIGPSVTACASCLDGATGGVT